MDSLAMDNTCTLNVPGCSGVNPECALFFYFLLETFSILQGNHFSVHKRIRSENVEKKNWQ